MQSSFKTIFITQLGHRQCLAPTLFIHRYLFAMIKHIGYYDG